MKNLNKFIIYGATISVIATITLLLLVKNNVNNPWVGFMCFLSVIGLIILLFIFLIGILTEYRDLLYYFSDGKITEAKHLGDYLQKIYNGSKRERMFHARIAYAYFDQNMMTHITNLYFEKFAKQNYNWQEDFILKFFQFKNAEVYGNNLGNKLEDISNSELIMAVVFNHVKIYGYNFHTAEELGNLVYEKLKNLHISSAPARTLDVAKFSKNAADFIFLCNDLAVSSMGKGYIISSITSVIRKLYTNDKSLNKSSIKIEV